MATRENIVIRQGDDFSHIFDVPELEDDDLANASLALWAGAEPVAQFWTDIDYIARQVRIMLPGYVTSTLTRSCVYDLELVGETRGRRTERSGRAVLGPEVTVDNSNELPVRFPDVSFYYASPLNHRLTFWAEQEDGEYVARLDISDYAFTATAKSESGVVLDTQPTLDASNASEGYFVLRWTLEQVEELPDVFWVEISEHPADSEDGDPNTWDELPELTWDQLPEFAWDEFPDNLTAAPIWDAIILVGKFVRNTNGF